MKMDGNRREGEDMDKKPKRRRVEDVSANSSARVERAPAANDASDDAETASESRHSNNEELHRLGMALLNQHYRASSNSDPASRTTRAPVEQAPAPQVALSSITSSEARHTNNEEMHRLGMALLRRRSRGTLSSELSAQRPTEHVVNTPAPGEAVSRLLDTSQVRNQELSDDNDLRLRLYEHTQALFQLQQQFQAEQTRTNLLLAQLQRHSQLRNQLMSSQNQPQNFLNMYPNLLQQVLAAAPNPPLVAQSSQLSSLFGRTAGFDAGVAEMIAGARTAPPPRPSSAISASAQEIIGTRGGGRLQFFGGRADGFARAPPNLSLSSGEGTGHGPVYSNISVPREEQQSPRIDRGESVARLPAQTTEQEDDTVARVAVQSKTDHASAVGGGEEESVSDAKPKRVLLALGSDKDALSQYQCLLRKQVFFFEATEEDVRRSAQGRNKPIVLNQVGLLCRHCARLKPSKRPRGSVYFPGRLSGVYQSVQNLVKNHFMDVCEQIPQETKEKMQKLRETKDTVWGGGRQYWVHSSKMHGLIERDDALFFGKGES